MIIEQFIDPQSKTLSYVIALHGGGEALIIDPVSDQLDEYLKFIGQHELKLVKAVDTHIHADHITALPELREITRCLTVMGAKSQAELVSMRVDDGDVISVEGIDLEVLYTPGHTDDSYSFYFRNLGTVFTGDTLLIRGTGRTDFQNGDPGTQWDSIQKKLLSLPDSTVVYPAHDYKGENCSSIGIEKKVNPRLQVADRAAYIELMNNLNLPNPKLMDMAVPANQSTGRDILDRNTGNNSVTSDQLDTLLSSGKCVLVDLREEQEIQKQGFIDGTIFLPYQKVLADGDEFGQFVEDQIKAGKSIICYCAYGERSALARDQMLEAGLSDVKHLSGGFNAYRNIGNKVKNKAS